MNCNMTICFMMCKAVFPLFSQDLWFYGDMNIDLPSAISIPYTFDSHPGRLVPFRLLPLFPSPISPTPILPAKSQIVPHFTFSAKNSFLTLRQTSKQLSLPFLQQRWRSAFSTFLLNPKMASFIHFIHQTVVQFLCIFDLYNFPGTSQGYCS